MPTSRLALKLTSRYGATAHSPGRAHRGKRLDVGMVIKARPARAKWQQYSRSTQCNICWVHAYRSLRQAQNNDHAHCWHGPRGVLWLVRLYGAEGRRTKLVGTSYKVLRKIGRMGDVDPKKVAALLKGKR